MLTKCGLTWDGFNKTKRNNKRLYYTYLQVIYQIYYCVMAFQITCLIFTMKKITSSCEILNLFRLKTKVRSNRKARKPSLSNDELHLERKNVIFQKRQSKFFQFFYNTIFVTHFVIILCVVGSQLRIKIGGGG